MAITEKLALPSSTPGVSHSLLKHSFGNAASDRSAYIQAGMHADEHPGLLVIQHLLNALQILEGRGKVNGRITVVPFANPVGLGQQVFGQMPGRYNLVNGENFNRNFPDITEGVASVLAGQHVAFNDTRRLKEIFADVLGDAMPVETVEANKFLLLQEALRHDILLDLHCDTSSVLHIYANLNQQERALSLARCTGVKAVFLEEEAGGFPLDEAFAKAWKQAEKCNLVDTKHLGFSATIELRGQADVEDDIAAADAQGILRFLQAEGLITLEEPVLGSDEGIQVYPLEGIAHLKSTATGIIAWKKKVGEHVSIGEVIAEVVALDMQLGSPRTPVISNVDGILVARHHIKLVRGGQKIGLLAGKEPLADRKTGKLMGI